MTGGVLTQDSMTLLLEQAAALLKEGRLEDAVDAFSACLAVEPGEPRALHGRASARVRLGQWPEAEADFRAARSASPDDPDLWGGLALALASQNKVYPALELLEGLLARHPAYVQGHIQMGLLQFKLGAIPHGRDALRKALSFRPSLAQRRLIETAVKEQDALDRKRFYRPDFERLRRAKGIVPGGGLWARIAAFFGGAGRP